MPVPTTISGAREFLENTHRAPSANRPGVRTRSNANLIKSLNRQGGFSRARPFQASRGIGVSPRPVYNTIAGRAAINNATQAFNRAATSRPVQAITNKLPSAAAVSRVATPQVSGGLATAGFSLVTGALDGNLSGSDVAGAAGAGIGATAGAYAGGAIGVIGGPIGAAIGSYVGSALGGYVGQLAGQSLFPNRDGPADDYSELEAAPFTGGQGAGVQYQITSQGRTSVNGEIRISPPNPNVTTGIGPIGYYYPDTTENTEGTTLVDSTGRIVANVRVSSGNPETKLTADFIVLDVIRTDGLPDTDGNAAGTPRSTPRGTVKRQQQQQQQSTPSDGPQIPPWALAPALIPALAAAPQTQLPGPGPAAPTRGATNRTTRRRPQLPRTANSSGGARPPTRRVTRTRTRSNCGCNRGILDGVSNLLGNNSVNIANSGLLATILGLLQQVGDVVGLGAFPITAPANLNAKATGTTTLNNLGEAHLWQAKNLDSTIGGWPNTIQDLDSGNPLENLTVSDSLAEIQGMLMAMAVGQGINQQGIFKTLTETTGIKQQSMLARQFSQANAEYLGYNLNQTTRTVPNTYTPGVENILELLNPGKIPMEAVENVDDMDLQSCLRELCASAAIIRAVFFRNTGTDDIEQALREKIDQARNVNDTAGSGDFREYLNQVEQGFGFPNPYGRDQTQGPRLSDRSDPTTP